MKNISIIILFASISLCFNGCDLFDDSPCGPKKTYDLYLLGSSIVDTSTGVYYSYLDGQNRVFQFSNIVENVCPEEHVKFSFRTALLDESTSGIFARGRVSWQFLFEKEVLGTKSGSDVKGNGDAGLKQAFGEEPGWFVPALEVYFETKGSYSADTAFFKKNVISVEMMANYRELIK